ncbi:hypothetical protein D3OALGA1CA_3344 [Olavius algarvensis associated proteobacterium Delta 3]|nr:hypothetical protein D3OALGA1CA_3344 [Olavius algarvensis associated proteobacterium Delta 3]
MMHGQGYLIYREAHEGHEERQDWVFFLRDLRALRGNTIANRQIPITGS